MWDPRPSINGNDHNLGKPIKTNIDYKNDMNPNVPILVLLLTFPPNSWVYGYK